MKKTISLLILLLFVGLKSFSNEVLYDYSNVISNKQDIINKINNINLKNKVSLKVIIIDKLPNDISIEDYSIKMSRDLKIGSSKYNNGLLYTIAISNRKNRLEVGRGLEGYVTDIVSNKIISSGRQYYKDNNFELGLNEVLNSLDNTLSESLNERISVYQNLDKPIIKKEETSYGMIFLITLFLIIFSVSLFLIINKIRSQYNDNLEKEKEKKKLLNFISKYKNIILKIKETSYIANLDLSSMSFNEIKDINNLLSKIQINYNDNDNYNYKRLYQKFLILANDYKKEFNKEIKFDFSLYNENDAYSTISQYNKVTKDNNSIIYDLKVEITNYQNELDKNVKIRDYVLKALRIFEIKRDSFISTYHSYIINRSDITQEINKAYSNGILYINNILESKYNDVVKYNKLRPFIEECFTKDNFTLLSTEIERIRIEKDRRDLERKMSNQSRGGYVSSGIYTTPTVIDTSSSFGGYSGYSSNDGGSSSSFDSGGSSFDGGGSSGDF